MASWRRKVLALFPDLQPAAQRPNNSIYTVFFELLPRVREAHQEGDAEMLRRIYGFAEWCLEQKAKDIWNAAGVAFYEHLFDSHRSLWSQFVRWLSPRVVEDCWQDLKSKPRRVTWEDVPIPFSPPLEEAVTVTAADIATTVRAAVADGDRGV